jgi:hypothetical protein
MTETEEQTEFKFSELSERAKGTARVAHRDWNVHDDWWDYTYEDAVRMAEILGITVRTDTRLASKGKPYVRTCIYFSGFCSQGDGASFEGDYEFMHDAVAKIKAETTDEKLIRFAEELTVLQVTARLKYGLQVRAKIDTNSGNCSHSMTMGCAVFTDDDGDENEYLDDTPWLDIFRRFADWIYASLESEYDHLTSDEVIDEHLADLTFDEDGAVI